MLPFGTSSRQSKYSLNQYVGGAKEDEPIRSIVTALHNINAPALLAHINVTFEQVKFCCAGKIWVEISTMPTEYLALDVPCVMKDGIVTVRPIWVSEAHLSEEVVMVFEEKTKTEAWERYFRQKLGEVKRAQENQLNKAMEIIRCLTRCEK